MGFCLIFSTIVCYSYGEIRWGAVYLVCVLRGGRGGVGLCLRFFLGFFERFTWSTADCDFRDGVGRLLRGFVAFLVCRGVILVL